MLVGLPPVPFDAARRDGVFALDAAAFHYAPARRFEGGVDMLGSGLGFVHGSILELAGEGVVEKGFFQVVERVELCSICVGQLTST